MTNFSECKLRIRFKLGKCNNKLFNINVNKQELIPTETDSSIYAVFEQKIKLPTSIEIRTYGKDPNIDTIIDKDGKIVQDLYAQIIEVSLDNFQIAENYLHQKIKVVTDSGAIHTTSYIGFNALTTLNFCENDVFSQVMVCNE